MDASGVLRHRRRIRRDPLFVERRLDEPALAEVFFAFAGEETVSEQLASPLETTALPEIALMRNEDVPDHPRIAEHDDVLACGGDAAAQAIVRELTMAIPGARYLHAGPLVASRLVEAAATMLIAINIRHKSHSAGMRITGIM